MKPTWIKWYPVQWLHSTARDEMSAEERATFQDFVCLAAISAKSGQFKFASIESLSRQLNTNKKVIEKTIAVCTEKQRISIYEDEEGYVCEILKWHIYQSYKDPEQIKDNNKNKKIPIKLTLNEQDKIREEKKRKDKIRQDNKNISAKPEPLQDPFEEFWEAYPKKKGKKAAALKFKALNKKQQRDAITGAINYASECRNKGTEAEYIKHPEGFLNKNKEMWSDYLVNKSLPFSRNAKRESEALEREFDIDGEEL